MASFDFARDMMDNLEAQDIGYILITVHRDHKNKTEEFVVTSFEKLGNKNEKFAALCGLQKQLTNLEADLNSKKK